MTRRCCGSSIEQYRGGYCTVLLQVVNMVLGALEVRSRNGRCVRVKKEGAGWRRRRITGVNMEGTGGAGQGCRQVLGGARVVLKVVPTAVARARGGPVQSCSIPSNPPPHHPSIHPSIHPPTSIHDPSHPSLHRLTSAADPPAPRGDQGFWGGAGPASVCLLLSSAARGLSVWRLVLGHGTGAGATCLPCLSSGHLTAQRSSATPPGLRPT